MDTDPQPSGICQRLLRLVLGALRRPSALPAPPTRVLNGENSEIAVDFRHTTDSVGAKHVQIGEDKKERDKGKKSVTIEGSERKEETRVLDDHDDMKSTRHWPLLNVASNINEKSEAFIQRKKKAMGRNYSLNQDHKK